VKNHTPTDGYYNALVQGDTGGEMHQVVRVHGGRVYTAHPYELKPSACSQFTPLETQSYCTHWPQLAAGELEALRTANAALVERVKRIEAAGDKLAARYMSSLPQGGKAAQHVREYHREKEQL
jgi:hypothetical protein